MSKSKPTPGPWHASRNHNSEWPHKTEIRTESGHMIANTDYWEDRLNESTSRVDEANARLIAAAPELFDALCQMVRASESGGVLERSQAFLAAYDAIDKAELG